MVEKIRLQKFLSSQGYCSRREAENLIRNGRIVVNDKVSILGDHIDGSEVILIDGEKLKIKKNIAPAVYAFHKPEGVESTLRKDPHIVTLASFDFPGRVFNIGRLDMGSTGLLLMTNDGDLANLLMHPRYEKEKEYLVSLNKEFSNDFLQKMSEGVKIAPKKITKPCRVEKIEGQSRVFRIILKEGKNRQIRRMCEVLGFKVIELHRIRIGNIFLGKLKPGKFRKLSDEDIKQLRK